MPLTRYVYVGFLLISAAVPAGCQVAPALPRDRVQGTRAASSDFVDGPAPLRTPSPARAIGAERFEDAVSGGEIFQMYCASCHNRRPMTERPFANYRNVAAHMRTRANLTGKESEKLVEWMRRVQDAPLPDPDRNPSPKRFHFSRPISELHPTAGGAGAGAGAADPGSLPIPDEAISGR